MNRRQAMWLVLAAPALAGVVSGYRRYQHQPPEEPAAVLEDAQHDAWTLQNRLVSSRHLTDAAQASVPRWTAAPPWTEASLLASPAPVERIVVYVHGYNTPFANTIVSGNALVRRLTALDAAPRDATLFFTFCWRGDFGALHFGEAERSATAAGASLADFLRRVSDAQVASNRPRIVVLAHSLGSRVALVATKRLWDEAPRTRLEHLVLIQPAVPKAWLYVGKVDTFLSPNRTRDSDGGGLVHVSQHEHLGPYIDSLRVARQVTITTSAGDAVLNGAYRTARHDYLSATAYRRFPNLDEPLGLPRGAGERPSPHYREIELKPPMSQVTRSHSGLYLTDDIIGLVWRAVLAGENERSRGGN